MCVSGIGADMMLNFELYVDKSCLYLCFFFQVKRAHYHLRDIKKIAKDAYPDQSYFRCSHLHHPWIRMTYAAPIDTYISTENADLIFLTGDQLTANNIVDNATSYFDTLGAHMELGFIFGNHNDSSDLTLLPQIHLPKLTVEN